MAPTSAVLLLPLLTVAIVAALLPLAVRAGIPPPPGFCQREYTTESCSTNPPFPQVAPTDVIEVWLLEDPLFEAKAGNVLGELNMYHASVGFRDLTTRQNWTVEYDAFYEVKNATFPWVYEMGNGTKELVWCNDGVICLLDLINETRFDPVHFPSARQILMTTVSGAIFNQFIDWLPIDNATHPTYETWYVDVPSQNMMPVMANTCADFVWRALRKLYALGADFNGTNAQAHDWAILYAKNLTLVDYNDPAEKQQIVTFYESLALQLTTGNVLQDIEQVLKWLLTVFNGQKYVFNNGQYYRLDWEFPYFEFTYRTDPIGGGSSSSGNQKK